jgi:hypothetical protein
MNKHCIGVSYVTDEGVSERLSSYKLMPRYPKIYF